ncbi:hypothetical protein Misp01_22920 [Microtetraspora sp. NBRC 13810]|uniref:hypothetical protein n=1 Tax=Microtetraspora sp. NBRC 13810 TaxID=3030990 RepID=UPI0024A22FC9|nr:hypothetical protein [Microtetraspora sp. NBRC 13810]GLW07162.1 hypothetical protein Misp01_22920 [Microtetraspora sp. NBRC 13810]
MLKTFLIIGAAGLLGWPAAVAHAVEAPGRAPRPPVEAEPAEPAEPAEVPSAQNLLTVFNDEIVEPVSLPLNVCGNVMFNSGTPTAACNRGSSVSDDDA